MFGEYKVPKVFYGLFLLKTYGDMKCCFSEELETEMTFLGFLLMENRLKPDTTQVISGLKKAGLRSVMVTGDNIQTAISVARECGIVGSTEDVQIVTADQKSLSWAWTADMTQEDRVSAFHDCLLTWFDGPCIVENVI